jgi:hypothetical protein
VSGTVQTPAQATAAAEPSHDHLWNAWAEGRVRGYRDGYVHGVRWGLLCGACTAGCAAFLLFSAASALGWL